MLGLNVLSAWGRLLSPEAVLLGLSGGGRFVGRERELAELVQHLEAAWYGRGAVVLVAGEPGVGKTRLVLELAARARAQGCGVLFGRSYESEGLPPYLPVIEAIRDYVRTCPLDQLQAQLGEGAPEVALLVREVRSRLPRLSNRPSLGPDQDRYRLFESISDFLVNVARSTTWGLFLCLDDLHWADKPTLLLLQHLARRLPTAPLLVVGTYRTVDVDRTDPLSDLLANLSRERLCERLLVPPFSPEEAGALIAELNGLAPAAPAVVSAIYRDTGGNPFFVEEMVCHLLAEGHDLTFPGPIVADWGIPEGVRQVIGKRFSRLSAAATRLLQAGAVLGDGFTFEMLAAMGGTDASTADPATLLDALEEVLGAGLVRQVGGSYNFSHALVCQTVYAELSLPRKQQLHLRAAEAIERIHAGNLEAYLPELAHHFLQAGAAGVVDKGIDYALRAGERAQAVFAYEEAVRFFEMALQAADPKESPDAVQRCDVLLALGEALGPAGEPRRVFEQVAEEAFGLAEGLEDATRAARAFEIAVDAVRRYGGPLLYGTALFRRWAQRGERYSPGATRGRVQADLALSLVTLNENRWVETRALASRAMELARELGDAETLFRAASALMRPFWAPQRWDEQRRLADEFTTHRPEGVSPRALRSVLRRSQLIYLAAGERARADEVRGDLDEFASRAGDAVLLLWPLEVEALLATLDGQLEMAVAAGERFRARADELGMSMHGRFTAHGLTWRPLLYLGRTGASPAGSDGETSEDQLISRRVEALVCLAHGGPTSELRDELRRLLQRIDPMDSEEAPADWLGKLLEASLLLDNRDVIALLVPKLDGIVATNDLFSVNNVARQVGAAYALLEDRTAATAQYQRALEWATKIRFRPEIALTRLALAELLADGDAQQRSESRGHLDFAVEEFRTMNMRPALERALRLQAGQPGRAAPRARPVYPGGLSEREVEVLRLVAGGKSNRDIAAMLVISLSTVAHHVSSVLAKTDAANRAEAASYATRHGLV